MRRDGPLLAAVLLCACTEGALSDQDLGPLVPADVVEGDQTPVGDGGALSTSWCMAQQGPLDHLLLVAGQMFEMSLENQDPGKILSGQEIKFFDYCGQPFAQAVSGEDGTFSFQIEVSEKGFDGYAEYTAPGYPLFRQFDKPFAGHVIPFKFRLFAGPIFDGPLMILGQKDSYGFAQGSVYNLVGEDPIPGVVIKASSGNVAYFSDEFPVPDPKLDKSQSQGVFFVWNAKPGELKLEATLPDGRIVEKTVRIWPLNSYPEKTITTVGIPVYPDLGVCED